MAAKKQIVVLLLCLAFSVSLAVEMLESAPGRTLMVDFGGVYFGARCALRHIDPYDSDAVLHEFKNEGGRFLPDPHAARASRYAVTLDVYLPSALFLAVPFAILPWAVAQNLWIFLTAALLAWAAFLMVDLGGKASSVLSCCLLGFMLANSELLFKVGNPAGVAVALCAIGAWCFLRHRFALAGILLFAISLAIKPHDAGFVWLFFLLSGGVMRKRALQTLALTAALGICSAIWIAHSSPHWARELQSNLAIATLPGSVNDPGSSGISNRGIVPIISLQSALSMFANQPRFYNPASYLLGGIPILMWIILVLSKPFSTQRALLSLAAVSVLTMLPIYHRTYDTKLLLLTIPACALLWSGTGAKRWIALALTTAALFFTGDLPLAFLLKLAEKLPDNPPTMAGKVASLAVLHPAPLVLLALGYFYLWVCFRYQPPVAIPPLADASTTPAAAAAT
jgi:hypothetical protein